MNSEINKILSISPVDGRYKSITQPLSEYFSEFALIKYRVYVEIEYFLELTTLPIKDIDSVSPETKKKIKKIYQDFSENDAIRIKEIEKEINHDVKAVEYFIKEEFEKLNLEKFKEFIHFGLTSQDINNTAIPLMIKNSISEIIISMYEELNNKLSALSKKTKNVPMVARTHGQVATPTTFGKEIQVFEERIKIQLKTLKNIPHNGKFGGASGNLNAHYLAFPNINWDDFSDKFLKKIGLIRSKPTTQIEHYDNMASIFHAISRINTILIDFSRDIWHYISINYLVQKIKKGEVGSSAMPHKVNPIDFENSEGNLGIANGIYEHLSGKLPISRLQRDLTDSTVLRNIGVPIGHSLIGLASTLKGLGKLLLNEAKLKEDLDANWAVVAEAIQTILRREGYPKPYEALKALTRTNDAITETSIANFIETLNVSDDIKKELKSISPYNYTGLSASIV